MPPQTPDDRTLRVETSRKVLHLGSALIPLAYFFLDRPLMLWLLAAGTAFAVVVEGLRHASPAFAGLFRRVVGFMVRDKEWGRLSGATYVLIAALASVWVFPKPIAIAVLLLLSVSDTAASLVGLRFGRVRFLGKSLAGSSAFFLTALAILWLALPQHHGVAVVAAVLATVVEAVPSLRVGWFELNDNLMIPLLTGWVIWYLQSSPPTAEIAALF